MLKIAILSGGNGTRLWPLSRSNFPKQFSKIIGDRSLFQMSIQRSKDLLDPMFLASLSNLDHGEIEVISNEKFQFLIDDQANENGVKISSLILESSPKNTACAICMCCLNSNENDIILAFPSDHIIQGNYQENIKEAIFLAQDDKIVTLGITPTFAHTGYGYIHNAKKVTFKEKPDSKTAQKYFESGEYLWNAGIFIFKSSVMLNEIKTYESEIYESCVNEFNRARSDNSSQKHVLKISTENIKEQSIDFAVMERSDKIACIKANFNWNDVGSFDSLCDEFSKNCHFTNQKDNNIKALDAPFVSENSSNNFIHANKLVAAIGVNDFVIVDSNDALLIAKRNQTQNIKNLIPSIKNINSDLCDFHSITHRPWGSYTVLLEQTGYKIKKIVVHPNKRLSLQKHAHRSEHWVVASGLAQVTIEDKIFILNVNESTFIPIGKLHRLENIGKIDLIIIEIQLGEYLGEDDITRFEDDFKRI